MGVVIKVAQVASYVVVRPRKWHVSLAVADCFCDWELDASALTHVSSQRHSRNCTTNVYVVITYYKFVGRVMTVIYFTECKPLINRQKCVELPTNVLQSYGLR